MNTRKPQPTSSQKEENQFIEKVVFINRCAKVVKGGRRFSFSAVVVTGDQKGRIGTGFGKAKEVPEAIRKSGEQARKTLFTIQLKGDTIPHQVIGVQDGGKVLLRPACQGTGIIAGGAVRALLEAVGIKDVLTKSLGSNNPRALVNATLKALLQLRSKETFYALRAAQ
jgi:small subunit ribosomal protein S5